MKLKQVYKSFPTKESCTSFLEKIIWNNKPVCPYCKSVYISTQHNEGRYHCNTCNTGFSVTVGTIFHKTKLDLQKWFYLIHKIYSGNPIDSLRGLGEEIKVTKDTANKMMISLKRGQAVSPALLTEIYNHIKALTHE